MALQWLVAVLIGAIALNTIVPNRLQVKEEKAEDGVAKPEGKESQKVEEKVKGLPSLGPRPKKKSAASEE